MEGGAGDGAADEGDAGDVNRTSRARQHAGDSPQSSSAPTLFPFQVSVKKD